MSEEPDRVAMESDLTSLKGDIRRDMESLEGRLVATIKASAKETRRHFDMVAEQMRAEFELVADKTVATGEKVDRLVAQNAIEHAAFVEAIANHEDRQRALEKMHEPPNP